jgi:hypothetical protein
MEHAPDEDSITFRQRIVEDGVIEDIDTSGSADIFTVRPVKERRFCRAVHCLIEASDDEIGNFGGCLACEVIPNSIKVVIRRLGADNARGDHRARLSSGLQPFPCPSQKFVERRKRGRASLDFCLASFFKKRLNVLMAVGQSLIQGGIGQLLVEGFRDRTLVLSFRAHFANISHQNLGPYRAEAASV